MSVKLITIIRESQILMLNHIIKFKMYDFRKKYILSRISYNSSIVTYFIHPRLLKPIDHSWYIKNQRLYWKWFIRFYISLLLLNYGKNFSDKLLNKICN